MTFLTPELTNRALADVAGERLAQEEKWGRQRHPFAVWAAIMAEEVGELAEQALHVDLRLSPGVSALQNLYTEAIQAAAVAVAIAEHAAEAAAKEE